MFMKSSQIYAFKKVSNPLIHFRFVGCYWWIIERRKAKGSYGQPCVSASIQNQGRMTSEHNKPNSLKLSFIWCVVCTSLPTLVFKFSLLTPEEKRKTDIFESTIKKVSYRLLHLNWKRNDWFPWGEILIFILWINLTQTSTSKQKRLNFPRKAFGSSLTYTFGRTRSVYEE